MLKGAKKRRPRPSSLAFVSKGKVRIINSATSNRTSPPQSHNLLALLEGPDRTIQHQLLNSLSLELQRAWD